MRSTGPIRPWILLHVPSYLAHRVRVGDQILRTRLCHSSIPIQNGQQLKRLSQGAVPRRLSRAFGPFLRALVRLLELRNKRAFSRLAHRFSAADDLPDGLVPPLEVLRESEPR